MRNGPDLVTSTGVVVHSTRARSIGIGTLATPVRPDRRGAKPGSGTHGHRDDERDAMADEVEFESRMSAADALMWTIEKDPLLRSTITTVMVFDRPLDHDRLRHRLDRVSRVVPRLRQRVQSHTFSLAPPRWDVDPNFDLDYHLRFTRIGDPEAPGRLRHVFDIAEPVAMQGFDRARPLWEFVVVDGVDGGGSALITKIHHSITDGVGGIKLLMELLDLDRDVPDDELPEAPVAVPRGEPGRVADAVTYQSRRSVGALTNLAGSARAQVGRVTSDPLGIGTQALATAGSVARMVSPATAPMSPLMTGRSLSVHFDALRVPVVPLKRAAKLVGGKLNDAFVAGVTGGLGRYHRELGQPVDQLRMTMPINIRRADTAQVAGNQFAPARFAVPVGIIDPLARMNAGRELMAAQRREPGLALSDALAEVINRLPATASTGLFGSMLKGIDFVTSNVPGPPVPVYLIGARLERQIAFGPMTGSAANITVLSYIGELDIGVNTDPRAVDHPDLFIDCLRQGFDEIVSLG
jgi:diacylglycerol O-acyltransferase / wax synthase